MRAIWIHRSDRQGLTLIELLVAVTIMLMITAIAIPLVAPSGDERRTRETSRLVTSFFQGARTRAIQTGRPFGVMIEAIDNFPQTGVQLSYAEVQVPYSGDTTSSRVVVAFNSGTSQWEMTFATGDAAWIGLVRPGDLLKLNYQGHYFLIAETDVDSNGYINSGSLPWPIVQTTGTPFAIAAPGVPFQIFRQPVKTAAPPLTLPEGMVVDLSGSGWGTNVFGPEPFADANNNKTWDGAEIYTDFNGSGSWDIGFRGPFVILFSPGGGLSAISLRQPPSSILANDGARFTQTPSSTLHLLLGKVENTPAVPGQENWRDLTSIWVSIHPQTGLVTGTEVGGDQNGDGAISLAESRYFAERGQSMGGR